MLLETDMAVFELVSASCPWEDNYRMVPETAEAKKDSFSVLFYFFVPAQLRRHDDTKIVDCIHEIYRDSIKINWR